MELKTQNSKLKTQNYPLDPRPPTPDPFQSWRRVLATPAPFVLLLVGLLALGLAWQTPFSYTLDSGGPLSLDQPFFRNFNSLENTVPKGNQGEWFRWSKGEGSLDFPGVGRRAYRVQFNLFADLNPNKKYTLYANTQKIAEGVLEPGVKTYTFEIPASAISYKDGGLRLGLQMESFRPKEVLKGSSDPRELGFALFSARLEAVGGGPVAPPLTHLGWLLGTIMLAYLIIAGAGLATWKAAGAAAILGAIPVYIIATPSRIWLTLYSPELAFAFGWALLMVIIAAIFMRKVWTAGFEQSWVLAIFGLALALRLAGLLHPQALNNPSGGAPVIDLGFHLNRFRALWDSGLWWDKIESAEWGGRLTYYPHATYLMMGLFQWLIPDRKLLILVWMATLESSRILLLFYLVKKTIGDGRSAIIAAFLIAALPVNTLSLAWGQAANLFGEWLITVALCIAVVKWEQLRKPGYFAILTATLLASFIVHPGEVLLSGVVFGLAGGLLFIRPTSRKQAKYFLMAYGLAIILAFASYHWVTVQEMIPQALSGATANPNKPKGFRTGGSVADPRLPFVIKEGIQSVPEMLYEGALGFWREARIYYYFFPILLFGGAVVSGQWSVVSSRRRKTEDGRPKKHSVLSPQSSVLFPPTSVLGWFGLAWAITGVLFAIVGLLLSLYVRYSLFMLPYIAVGSGVFLGGLWRRQAEIGRGWAAAFLTCALLAFFGISTLALFFDRMIYLYHGP